EAFGLVQVEALASGCPVVNTAIPASGVAWVSRHEETGLTVPINNPVALADASHRVLGEPGLLESLAGNAQARGLAGVGSMLMARRTLDVYQRVLAGKARARQPVAV